MGERVIGKNKQKDEVVRKNKPPRPEKMIFLQQNICGSGHPFKEKEGKFLQYMFYLDVL
jgi:hypothetical protein